MIRVGIKCALSVARLVIVIAGCAVVGRQITTGGKHVHVVVIAMVVAEAVVRLFPGTRPFVHVFAVVLVVSADVVGVIDKVAVLVKIDHSHGFT